MPFIGEIRLFAFDFAPVGWAACEGQRLPIAQNERLFAQLGTSFGGDGRTTFCLPDLRGRVGVGAGDGRVLGERGGEALHALTTGEVASHDHVLRAGAQDANAQSPTGRVLARTTNNVYRDPPSPAGVVDLASAAVATAGSGVAHENRQPYLTLVACIALAGTTPRED